ncbi:MAG: hypothetical protein HYS13_21010, partial [Planctomycetia bacterium]|nr:hypothetical protein [Planctomycetia bacterium]
AQGALRKRLTESLGGTAGLASVQATVLSREETDGYVREDVELDLGRGLEAGANLLSPADRAGRGPAIVVYAGEPDGDRPNPSAALAEDLVRYGYVVLEVPVASDAEKKAGADGRQQQLRSDLAAFAYLRGRRDVDPERVGVCGVSSGAWRALWVAAVEPRACVLVQFVPSKEPEGTGSGSGDRDLAAALVAPRGWLTIDAGKLEWNGGPTARSIYAAHDVGELKQKSIVSETAAQDGAKLAQLARDWLKDEL